MAKDITGKPVTAHHGLSHGTGTPLPAGPLSKRKCHRCGQPLDTWHDISAALVSATCGNCGRIAIREKGN